MRRQFTALLCVLLLCTFVGCQSAKPVEEESRQEASAEPTVEPEKMQGLESAPEPEPSSEPALEPEAADREGRVGDYLFKVVDAYKSTLWNLDVLFVSVAITSEVGELDLGLPPSAHVFQGGSELIHMLNPDCLPAGPDDPMRAEMIIQLKNAQDDVKIQVSSLYRFETVLKLNEIEAKEEEYIVKLYDQYTADVHRLKINTSVRGAMPDQWPVGMPFYEGSWRLQPSISDTVDTEEYGAIIDFRVRYEFDLFCKYMEKCVALGYVESEKWYTKYDPSKPYGKGNLDYYDAVLTGQGYVIKARYTYAGEDAFNWCGFYVKRIRE